MAEWHRVASDADLKPDAPIGVRVGEVEIAVVRSSDDGGVYAVNNVCTHEYALLSEGFCENGRLECPLHQALFDLRTGEGTDPAPGPVATYPTKVEGGAVFVQV